MVVSKYSTGFPGPGMPAREIAGGPLYTSTEVMTLLAEKGSQVIRAWTRKCIDDIQKLCLDDEDVFELVTEAVRCGRFTGSEWCEQQPNGPWAACDAYELKHREWSDVAKKELEYTYYIKFAIGMTGAILLLVSCHLSN
jgi:hypothetical protein